MDFLYIILIYPIVIGLICVAIVELFGGNNE